MATLHYGTETFVLAPGEEWTRLAEMIEERLRNRGGWVDVATTGGTVTVFVTSGIVLWVDQRGAPAPSNPLTAPKSAQ